MELARQEKLTEIENIAEIYDRTAIEVQEALELAGRCLIRVERTEYLIRGCDKLISEHFLSLESVSRVIPFELFEPARNQLELLYNMAQDFKKDVCATKELMSDNRLMLHVCKKELDKKRDLTNRALTPEHLTDIVLPIPKWIEDIPLWWPQELNSQWEEMNLPQMVEECDMQICQLIKDDLAESTVDN